MKRANVRAIAPYRCQPKGGVAPLLERRRSNTGRISKSRRIDAPQAKAAAVAEAAYAMEVDRPRESANTTVKVAVINGSPSWTRKVSTTEGAIAQ
jgi:hypothetical protein